MSNQIFHSMLQLQDTFNTKVHDQWKQQKFSWDTAIWVECGEMIDHLGYKWWKKQQPDIEQVILEMVDIWHFGMSYIMNYDDAKLDVLSHYLYSNYESTDTEKYDINEFKKFTNILVNCCTDTLPYFNTKIFFKMWKMLGKDLNDLYKMYVGKNALNEFRQLNGYKDGTYIKIWNGKEDNEVLTQILNEITIDTNLYSNTLNELAKNYEKI